MRALATSACAQRQSAPKLSVCFWGWGENHARNLLGGRLCADECGNRGGASATLVSARRASSRPLSPKPGAERAGRAALIE